MLRRVPVGSEGIEYIRSQLELGGRLAVELLRLPLEQGITFAYLPPSQTHGVIPDFRSGGILQWDESLRYLSHLVNYYLRQSSAPQTIAIFEEPFGGGETPTLNLCALPSSLVGIKSFTF